MGWIGQHPEAIVGAISLLLGLVTWIVQHRSRRKLINYRVHHDMQVVSKPAIEGMAELIVRRDGAAVPEAGVVLLRVRNGGQDKITKEDFELPLSFTFPDRMVIAAKVTEPEPRELLAALASDLKTGRVPFSDNTVELPKVLLNKNDRFRLLVLLSGRQPTTNVRDSMRVGGRIPDGAIEPDGLGRRARVRWIAIAVAALVFMATGGILVGRLISDRSQLQCASGSLTLQGSTAFAPIASALADSYHQQCPSLHIAVDASNSGSGTAYLEGTGPRNAAVRSSTIAMSDGVAAKVPDLKSTTEAIVLFSVVVNHQSGAPASLNATQLRAIFSGTARTWSQVGGSTNTPITVVSRFAPSGTRNTFDSNVMHEPESRSGAPLCESTAAGPDNTALCASSTQDLLTQVNGTDGAIGYAETSAVGGFSNVAREQINQVEPALGTIGTGATQYPFWAVEHFYTYGTPEEGTPAAAFLAYLNTTGAKKIIQDKGDVPCSVGEPDANPLCTQR